MKPKPEPLDEPFEHNASQSNDLLGNKKKKGFKNEIAIQKPLRMSMNIVLYSH